MKTKLENIILTLKENFQYLYDEYGVMKIGIFGSAIRHQMKKDSDIDLIIKLKEPLGFEFLDLIEYLETILDNPVDVFTEDGIDNIRIGEISDEIKKEVRYVSAS